MGGTVCIVADAVGRDMLILIFLRDIVVRRNCGCGTDRRAGAFSINVCVDNGIAGAAVDVNITGGAILVFALVNLGTNRRAAVAGSIPVGIHIGAKGIDRIYGAAGNVDGCCTARTVTISDRGSVIGTDGGNVGIFFNIDREIPGIAVLTGTDGAAMLNSLGLYSGIPRDRNGCSRAIPAVQTAITNGGTPSTVSINNGMVRNGDAVSAAGTAADCSALCTSSSNMCIALNADVLAGTAGSAAAANAGTAIISTNGSDLTAGDGNVGCITKIFPGTAADRGRFMVTASQQFAGVPASGISVFILVLGSTIIILIVLDGQGAGAVFVRFFDGGVFVLPPVLNHNGIIAVQLKVGIAVALYFDRTGLGFRSVNSNVHILQGHIGGVALFGVNGDGVGGGLGLAGGLVFGGQGDVGIFAITNFFSLAIFHAGVLVLILPLGDILLAALGKDVHTAFCYIVFCRKGCCGDGRDHGHQGRCGQHPQGKLFFHIFPHCKTLQTKTCRDVNVTVNVTGNDTENRQNPDFRAEKHIAVHFHARRLFAAQV